MPYNTKGKPVSELAVATTIVSAVPCGVVSIVVTGDGTNLATIKLYDHAATATGAVKKALASTTCSVYCPCKPDAFSVGVVVVVAGTGAKGYVSIE